ncbi:MAG: division/cell wall cluster transcriptional repressor MraZ [Oscillospiraceae bacterium]
MIGKYTAKVDEKGRLFVPAKLRGELGETFFVTIGTNGGRRCLTVYTQAGWESLCARYDASALSQKSGTTSFLFSNAVECSPDKQFRFLVSSNLYQYAGIDREVVIVGRAGQAEIWDADTYAEFEQAMLTPENLLASLEAIDCNGISTQIRAPGPVPGGPSYSARWDLSGRHLGRRRPFQPNCPMSHHGASHWSGPG